ncbi:MAG: flagellin [Cellulomonas iranensis]|uniref:flagellin N-terminal helical domain-containing protein n=1 Tax=Cellulomonas iranensis TaxID=76862 RepID=UPI001B2D843A|nr:flagellin [Cellulomonas iranensis]MBO9567961.1 flagellin [Cellulomonas iranensis]
MGLSINTNVAALNAYRNLGTTQGDLSKSLEKLSSGLRINRAADDAAGLAISEGLRAQIGGTKQAVRNAQDGISVVQTAEGALTETHSILQRMRTLAVQASNDGGLSTNAKQNIQDEIGQLQTELTRIADTTQFNGAKLLDGKYTGSFQVGANTSLADKITVDLVREDGVSAKGLGVDALDVRAAGTAASATFDADDFSATAVTAGGTDATDAVSVSINGRSVQLRAGAAAGEAVAELTVDDAVAAINAAKIDGVTASKNADGDVVISGAASPDAKLEVLDAAGDELTASATVVGVKSGADLAIDAIDAAITDVSSVRSRLGAVQNRFDHTINNLNVAVENLSASESRIRDTDMAQEMVSFTRSQILSQAGTAMLAQAKNLPQSVLSLLQ